MTFENHVSAVGPLHFLTEAQKRDLYNGALEVLGRIGMQLDDEEARDILLAAGATIDDRDRLLIPRRLVEDARASAPSTVPMFDRNGNAAMDLGAYRSYFGNGSDVMRMFDLQTGELRPTVLADTRAAAQLTDSLPNIDFIMSFAFPHDVDDPHRAEIENFRVMVSNSTKPLTIIAENLDELRAIWQVACALRGGEEPLRHKPYFVTYAQPSSPLEHPVDPLEKLLYCADKGIPVVYSPAPLTGATCPITVAGQLVQGMAESLAGLVIHQLRRPGAPFIFGIGPAVLDLVTTQSSYNAPEYLAAYLGAIEMARWLDLPNWGYAGTSDSHVVDAQAGMEAGEITLLSMLAGSNLNHDIGYLAFGLSCSLEMIVITDEYLAMNRRLLAGITVDRESMALDTIDGVGPGGHFMNAKHTLKNARSAQWRPTILNRSGIERWQKAGAPDLRGAARDKALKILSEYEIPALDEAVATRIDEIVDGFRPDGTPGAA
jgi:trimethylamine--corrinoid protein Co-methyltransferase